MEHLARAAIAAFATATLGAVAMASTLEPAPHVMPKTGTTLHFDEGGTPRTWVVKESKPGIYTMERNDRLAAFTSAGGIVSPAVTYKDDRGFDGTQRVTKGDPLQIYPIKGGNKVSFTVSGEVPTRGWKWTNEVACDVTGTERVKAPIGEFDTFVVTCVRSGNRGREQTVTRYYAPKLGLTVRSVTVDHINNNRWSTDLLKVEGP